MRAGPGNDRLEGGADTDDCDGEAGNDSATTCEILVGGRKTDQQSYPAGPIITLASGASRTRVW